MTFVLVTLPGWTNFFLKCKRDQGAAHASFDSDPPAYSWSYLGLLPRQYENCLQQNYRVEGAGYQPRAQDCRDIVYRIQKTHFKVHRAIRM